MELVGLQGIHQGRRIPINGSVVLGRNQQSCTIIYPDNTKGISRVHCKVDQTPSGCVITDLGSSYGTFVNGNKLTPNIPTPLREGDTFYLGNQSNSFSVSGGSSAVASSNSVNSKPKPKFNSVVIAGIAAVAVVIIAIIVSILFINMNNKYASLSGSTWKLAESPGTRMSFAENGDLLITNQGEFELYGTFTYSSVGDHMISVKYTAPIDSKVASGEGLAGLYDALGGFKTIESLANAYSTGYVWKYEYDRKTDSMKISDVNGYKLFTLEH
ncbi:FHA domain-containing protein [Butyrivibrio sp. WCD2001]|uniref:FHA domain-containing protein n=1 Tax=Butyrivibrio sp. WCD2001 TaxID=1280681 RepID=UPI0004166EC5|nr:FHA domain-containing protein [Butyrivibrio sp. WCD2001]